MHLKEKISINFQNSFRVWITSGRCSSKFLNILPFSISKVWFSSLQFSLYLVIKAHQNWKKIFRSKWRKVHLTYFIWKMFNCRGKKSVYNISSVQIKHILQREHLRGFQQQNHVTMTEIFPNNHFQANLAISNFQPKNR